MSQCTDNVEQHTAQMYVPPAYLFPWPPYLFPWPPGYLFPCPGLVDLLLAVCCAHWLDSMCIVLNSMLPALGMNGILYLAWHLCSTG